MRCWACGHAIGLHDEVCELPVAAALVHRACYERETGQDAGRWVDTLTQYLARHRERAA
jgi:hypothetical protein